MRSRARICFGGYRDGDNVPSVTRADRKYSRHEKSGKGTGHEPGGSLAGRGDRDPDCGRTQRAGYDILANGEMGIGNTTTSALWRDGPSGQAGGEVTGKGAGLTSEGLERKISVIKRQSADTGRARDDALDVMAKVGGLDIAGFAGVYLGGALYHIPVVVDGFISAVAALPRSRSYQPASLII